MQITLHLQAGLPGCSDSDITIAGDVITVDGTPYDLADVPEGGQATHDDPDCPIHSDPPITRVNDVINLHVRYRYDAGRAAPEQKTVMVDITSGPVPDPVLRNKELTA